MSNFGTKRKADWNAEDNAANAMSVFLSAEIRETRIAHGNKVKMTMAVVAGLVIAALYFVVELV